MSNPGMLSLSRPLAEIEPVRVSQADQSFSSLRLEYDDVGVEPLGSVAFDMTISRVSLTRFQVDQTKSPRAVGFTSIGYFDGVMLSSSHPGSASVQAGVQAGYYEETDQHQIQ